MTFILKLYSLFRRMQEKFSAEMRDLEASEQAYKDKWNETKSKLTEMEDEIISYKAAIRQVESEITEAHKVVQSICTFRMIVFETGIFYLVVNFANNQSPKHLNYFKWHNNNLQILIRF